ncbi:ABC transporter [Microbacterium sp. ET2]|uniref:ABC transporter n=1 Tax=Microbacterium albipurpureum TaxID=3050384 RepID=UPI00259CCF43|nr:ABC transporter [Microbacterium sp. ET2 (Ac-2212)]WJL94566.1 ABC transporter [Microbacterium sp. ET2 (Ac-2212)]
MSDSKSSYGDPVEEPRPADDDVVTRANEGLADAEAAREAAAREDAARAADPAGPADPDHRADGSPHHDSAAHTDAGDDRTGAPTPAADDRAYAPPSEPATVRWDAPADRDASDYRDDAERDRFAAYEASAGSSADSPSDRSVAPAAAAGAATGAAAASSRPQVTASEPAPDRGYDAPTVVSAPLPPQQTAAPQPIFVQAPEAPRPRGNRAAAGAIGLLAALLFGLLYLAAWLGLGALAGEVGVDDLASTTLAALASWSLWIPVLVFFIAFWLLGAIINRGRWGSWVIFGLLVGFAAWAGHILGQLFQAPFWTLTAREGAEITAEQVLAPLAIVAFILGRELTIWFGAWVAARGRRVTELNDEAQREYERTLEAGPQLVRQ